MKAPITQAQAWAVIAESAGWGEKTKQTTESGGVVNAATYIKWLTAMMLLEIWNPDKWDYYPSLKRKKQLQLFYKAKGIVCADRALTDRSD